jgi:hypothetical protein
MTQTAIVCVTNDLATDQRVHKACMVLTGLGFRVKLVGRKLKNSLLLKRNYSTFRMKLIFNNLPLFYAEYNIRLFFLLLFKKAGLIVANDLDTLPASFLASKIKGAQLVYDSHEYFCHVPELIHRPYVQKFWLKTERLIFPRLEHIITVNDSIAEKYRE